MHYFCHKYLTVHSHLLPLHMKTRILLYSPNVRKPMLKHTENYKTGRKATMFKIEKQKSAIKYLSLYTKFYFFSCFVFGTVFHFISQVELELAAILLSKPPECRDYSVCSTLGQYILYINKNGVIHCRYVFLCYFLMY